MRGRGARFAFTFTPPRGVRVPPSLQFLPQKTRARNAQDRSRRNQLPPTRIVTFSGGGERHWTRRREVDFRKTSAQGDAQELETTGLLESRESTRRQKAIDEEQRFCLPLVDITFSLALCASIPIGIVAAVSRAQKRFKLTCSCKGTPLRG